MDGLRRPLSGLLIATAAAWLAMGCESNIPQKPMAGLAPDQSASAPAPGASKTQPARIALLLPLASMGEPARIARGMKQAAEMALFDANDPAIQLIVKDDGGTAEGAQKAAETAISEGAEIILGPLFGKAAKGAGISAAPSRIPVMTFSNDPSVAGNGVYLASFLASDEVDRVVSFAVGKGKKRFAALIPATPYGQMVEPSFRKAVSANGGEIVAGATYTPDANGILTSAKQILERIKAAETSGQPVDALFMPSGPDEIAQLGPLLAYSGIDTSKVKLIGTSAWDVPVTARDDHMVGGWYAASDPAGWSAFSEKYQKTFGTPPPRLASLAYDAVAYSIQLSAVPPPARYAAENLTRPNGFVGIDGPVRFLPDGRSKRSLAVLEIEKYRSVVIDPAPPGDDQAAPRLAEAP